MPIIDPSSNIPHYHYQSPTETPPPKKPKITLPLLANILLVIFSAYSLTFIIFSMPQKMILDQNISIEIYPKYSIHASSLKEDIFSTTASLSLIDSSHISREPLDLAFVIDVPRAREPKNMETIQNAISDALPLLSDKDRLLTLVFDSSNDSLYNYVPLANTTEENKKTVFSNLGKEFSAKRSNAEFQGLRTALNQRKSMNSVTGILLYTWKCQREQISEMLQDLKSAHAFVFCFEPQGGSYIPFQDSLQELQNSVIGNVEFFVKHEDSELFQGVEIVKGEFKEHHHEEIPQRMFIGKDLSLFPMRQRLLVVDIKIPSPRLPLPKTKTTRAKIASFEMVFNSVSGQRVVKNEDYEIEIRGEVTCCEYWKLDK